MIHLLLITVDLQQSHTDNNLLLFIPVLYALLGLPSIIVADQFKTSYETRNKADLYLHSVNTTFGQRCRPY